MARTKAKFQTPLRVTTDKLIFNRAVRFIQKDVKRYAVQYLDKLLVKKRQATGQPMPEKAESTKRAYRKHGWNTENFLVRTGRSSVVQSRRVKNGIRLTPTDPKIIGYHDTGGFQRTELGISTSQAVPRKQAKPSERPGRAEKRVTWFRLNFGTRMQILKMINADIARSLGNRGISAPSITSAGLGFK